MHAIALSRWEMPSSESHTMSPLKRPSGDLTQKRDLRKRMPLWAATPRVGVITRKAAGLGHYDVVVVGAGIGGALMAHALMDQSLKVLVIDRRTPVRGSTMASTAMIQHEIDVPLHKLADMKGEGVAGRIWQRSARAVEDLALMAAQLDLRCSFERKRTLFLAGDAYGSRALATEAEARRKAGLSVDYLDAATLLDRHGIERTAALDSPVSASANPAQLTAALLRLARLRGVEMVAGVEITDLRGEDDVILATGDGQLISAGDVVFCTGYEFLQPLASKNHSLVSTWALASRARLKRPAWIDSYLVWEGSDPYLYFRSTYDGRVIVGGEDETADAAFQSEPKGKAKTKILVEKLADLTGMVIGEPDFAWSAGFGTTADGLPMIGRVPGFTHVYAAMGYGGNGITFSKIAADLISSEILGRPDPDFTLFPFH